MLSVDSDEIKNATYIGFSPRKIQFIKETIVRFQSVSFEGEMADNAGFYIDGSAFDLPQYQYWVGKLKTKKSAGVLVQVSNKLSNSDGIFRPLFGIYMFNEDGKREFVPYHTDGGSFSDKDDDKL